MGNCRGKTVPKKDPHHSFEVHKTSKHALRIGLETGKNPQGKITLGVRGGIDCHHDKIIKVDEDLEKIPKVLDLVENKVENKTISSINNVDREEVPEQ